MRSQKQRGYDVEVARQVMLYVEYWAKLLHEAGISTDKMYTHIAAGCKRQSALGTEANPQGLSLRGMAMDAYLKRHFDCGATLVVMNVGATSDALMRRLHDAVWGQRALDAYRAFLNGG